MRTNTQRVARSMPTPGSAERSLPGICGRYLMSTCTKPGCSPGFNGAAWADSPLAAACSLRRLFTPWRRRQRSSAEREAWALTNSRVITSRSSSGSSNSRRNSTTMASCAGLSVVLSQGPMVVVFHAVAGPPFRSGRLGDVVPAGQLCRAVLDAWISARTRGVVRACGWIWLMSLTFVRVAQHLAHDLSCSVQWPVVWANDHMGPNT